MFACAALDAFGRVDMWIAEALLVFYHVDAIHGAGVDARFTTATLSLIDNLHKSFIEVATGQHFVIFR